MAGPDLSCTGDSRAAKGTQTLGTHHVSEATAGTSLNTGLLKHTFQCLTNYWLGAKVYLHCWHYWISAEGVV